MSKRHAIALACKTYGKIYVGQTKQPLMDRLMEHFRNIRQNTDIHIVGRHYNDHERHGLTDVTIYVLEFIHAQLESRVASDLRDSVERKWICILRFQTPMGLNLFD